MFNKILTKIVGSSHEREMKRIQPQIVHINSLDAKIKALNNDQLKAKTNEFRERISRGETVGQILPEAFAVCREASSRVLGMRHYDVQLIGGIILNSGSIAEMRTGEGKTLVATLPVYLNALTGKGAHLVTVNDYLAKRDCEWMGQLYSWLGMSTGTIVHERSDRERKEAYGADITYGTNNEFGFDYLRDNMKFDLADYVQRPFNYAIVDECDSILIDEARTPLIISGPSDDSTDKYYEINKIIPHLKRDVHFTMEEKSRTASLTEEGNSKVEELLKIGNLFDPENIELLHHIYQGLKAHHLYQVDVDYMIRDGEILIVDEFTGRLMPGRRWSDGIHQAIEAKEGVDVKSENQTLATITFQNYFRMYPKLSGMTGTAETEAVEFKKIYSLGVSVIPTNSPVRRLDEQDVVYKTEAAKYRAIAKDIQGRFAKGQPVLVGTVSIEKSERLSRQLKHDGITHNVLNAKHHEREADIVAQAGRRGAVTIATNMAGRGTDIVLGGNPEALAKEQTGGAVDTADFPALVSKYKTQTAAEKEQVREAGGLYIIGTERHESRRIDNQLRGRSGRQGDPGESRFYLSLEDDLMRKFNGERVQKIMTLMNVPDDEAMSHRMVSNAIEGAQRKVEGHNFDIRKHLLDYDDVMNKQRTAIYGLRKDVLKGENIEQITLDMLSEVVSDILDMYLPEGTKSASWNIEGLAIALSQQFGIQVDASSLNSMAAGDLTALVSSEVKKVYDEQKSRVGEFWPQLQKMLLLQTIDQRWKEHLQVIDHLKEGIHLRGYAQKDPLIEYKKEGFMAFQTMNAAIRAEVIEKLIKIRIAAPGEAEEAFEQRQRNQPKKLQFQGSEASENASALKRAPATGGQPPAQRSQQFSGLPLSRPQQMEEGMDDYGGGGDGPKLNRAQRRQMEKKKKGR